MPVTNLPDKPEVQEQPLEIQETSSPKKFLKGVGKTTISTLLLFATVGTAIIGGALGGLALSLRNLPNVRILKNYSPAETTYIYDMQGRVLDTLHGEVHRNIVELDEISPQLKRAVLAIEDSHFYQHDGVNPHSVGRAFVQNVQQGKIVEGASTITMQLVRNTLLTRDRAFDRKLAETALALRVEQAFSKDEILKMYLNTIYWGHNTYGIQTAAKTYFYKSANELNLAESAMLAGMIQAPEAYSPFIDYEKTKARQAMVLDRMADIGWITPEQAEAAKKEPLLVGHPLAWQSSQLPYITDAVQAELVERFGKETVLEGGMRVQTTVDYDFQQMAKETVTEASKNLSKWGLEDTQTALVAIDPRTHYIKAMVGGVNYQESQLNRVTQSHRQPGSSFKPFVYYTAFASGKVTPHSTISDSPVRYANDGVPYRPKNYGGGYMGEMTVKKALMLSRNIPAVKLGQEVGINQVIQTTRTLGIDSPLKPVISLPLGAVGITPLEMANAYATFASNGWYAKPSLIVQVTDSDGDILLKNIPKPKQVLNPWATSTLTSALKGVIQEGTGTTAQIGRPAAGKTGTTSDERDVWFVGYVPQLATAVWVGRDDYKPMGYGVTGGGIAAPIWKKFMTKALENEPVKHFPAISPFTPPEPPQPQ